MNRIVNSVVVIGACALLVSCSSGPDEQITGVGPMSGEKKGIDNRQRFDTPFMVDQKPEQPSIQSLMGKSQQFPAKYPLAKYPNSSVLLVRIEPKLYPGWRNQVMLQSVDTPHSISTYYRQILPAQGWVKVSDRENRAYASSIWQKDGQEIEVRVTPDPHHGENIQLLSGPADTPPPAAGHSAGS